RVESRECNARPGIKGINLLSISGSVILRLAISIARQQLQPAAGMANAHLQRVVTGLSTGNEPAIALEKRPEHRQTRPSNGLTRRRNVVVIFPTRSAWSLLRGGLQKRCLST